MSENIDPREAMEQAEQAHHAAHSNDPSIMRVSLSIAVMAVIAAIFGSLETTESMHASINKNDAVLLQDKATDAWGFFQSKSLKKNMYEIAGKANAPANRPQIERYEAEEKDAQKQAEDFERQSEIKNAASEKHLQRHEKLTTATTMVHVSIALASLALLLRRKLPWYAAMALTALGVIFAVATLA